MSDLLTLWSLPVCTNPELDGTRRNAQVVFCYVAGILPAVYPRLHCWYLNSQLTRPNASTEPARFSRVLTRYLLARHLTDIVTQSFSSCTYSVSPHRLRCRLAHDIQVATSHCLAVHD